MERIKEVRKSKGWTQEQLADAVGVKRSVISKYESGAISPSAETIQRIADVLEVPIAYLFDELPVYRQTHIAGVHIFKNTFQSVTSELENLPENSYHIVYQDSDTLIAVDNDSPVTDEELSQILYAYAPKPILGSEIRRILKSESKRLGVPEDELSQVLLTQKPDGGGSYVLNKETLSFFFDSIYSKDDNPQDKILAQFNQLNLMGQYIAVERVEELTEIPKYRRQEPQEAQQPTSPAQEGNDTPAPESSTEGPQEPPEGDS